MINKSEKLISKIDEILGSSYEYTKYKSKLKTRHTYNFTSSNNHNFSVHVDHIGRKEPKANVQFTQTEHGPSLDMQHNEPNSAHKILSTVHKIIKDHVENHPEVKHVIFSAKTTEPSRVRTYAKLATRLSNKPESFKVNKKIYFTSHVNDMK